MRISHVFCLLSPEYAGNNHSVILSGATPISEAQGALYARFSQMRLSWSLPAPQHMRNWSWPQKRQTFTFISTAGLSNPDILKYPHHRQVCIWQTCGGGRRLLASKPTCLLVALGFFSILVCIPHTQMKHSRTRTPEWPLTATVLMKPLSCSQSQRGKRIFMISLWKKIADWIAQVG